MRSRARRLVDTVQQIALLAQLREQALGAIEVQRADGDEYPPVSEWKEQPMRHQRAAILDERARERGVMSRELGIAAGSRAVDPRQRREIAREPGQDRRFDRGLELGPMGKRMPHQPQLPA